MVLGFDMDGLIDNALGKAYVNTYTGVLMTTITATEARKNLYKLVESVSTSHIPLQISGKKNNAVLISEEDWNSIQETLHLVSIPKMRESIQTGMKAKLEDCSAELKW